jgi:hypothetical protein
LRKTNLFAFSHEEANDFFVKLFEWLVVKAKDVTRNDDAQSAGEGGDDGSDGIGPGGVQVQDPKT